MSKYMVVAGASGGHLFPALSLVEGIRAQDPAAQVLLVLPQKNVLPGGTVLPAEAAFISAEAIPRSFGRKGVYALARYLKSFGQSFLLLARFKPSVVVGFGSLVSVPCLFLGWLFRCHTLIHEQNVKPGAGNRVMAFFADKVCVSFAATRAFLKENASKVTVTGYPLRPGLVRAPRDEALRFFGFPADKRVILVAGGSQGSHALNTACAEALARLPHKGSIQVVHLAGAKECDEVSSRYRQAGIEAKVLPFLKEMHYAYSLAHLSVCRAGAGTVAELAHYKVPAILVPYPFAGGHQAYNAGVLEEKGCAKVIREEALTPAALASVVDAMLQDLVERERMSAAYKGAVPEDACAGLVKEVISW